MLGYIMIGFIVIYTIKVQPLNLSKNVMYVMYIFRPITQLRWLG